MTEVLDKYGIKYNKEGLIWTISASDAGVDELISNHGKNQDVFKTMTLFLEMGDSNAGFQHIWEGRQKDFAKLAGVDTEDGVKRYIYESMAMGHNATWGYKASEKGGFEVVYRVTERVFVHVVFGSNGFIVTAKITNNGVADYDKYPY